MRTAPCVDEFVRGGAFASDGEGSSNDAGVGPSAPPGIDAKFMREQSNFLLFGFSTSNCGFSCEYI